MNYSELAAASALDQQKQSLLDLAEMLGAYFSRLCERGFTRAEAMEIVLQYQDIILGGKEEWRR